jgi:hypothetical protein
MIVIGLAAGHAGCAWAGRAAGEFMNTAQEKLPQSELRPILKFFPAANFSLLKIILCDITS